MRHKTFKPAALFCFAAFAAIMQTSCGSDSDITEDTPITIAATEETHPQLTKDGGQATVSFTAPQAWTATVEETRSTGISWLSVSPTSGQAGDATITITAQPNGSGEVRTGIVRIKSGSQTEEIIVTQDYANFITLAQREIVAGAEGMDVELDIETTMDYEVVIPDTATWVTNGGQTRAVESHTHKLTIAPNESYDPRQTEVLFRSKSMADIVDTVKIYQTYKGAIVLAKSEYDFDAAGGELDFKAQTNVDINVTISDSWITQRESRASTRGLVDKNLYFDVAVNEDTENARTGTITLQSTDGKTSQTVTVRQAAKEIVLDSVVYKPYAFWEEAHDNMPLLYYACVKRIKYYSNGSTDVVNFCDYGHLVQTNLGSGVSLPTEGWPYTMMYLEEREVYYEGYGWKFETVVDSVIINAPERFDGDSVFREVQSMIVPNLAQVCTYEKEAEYSTYPGDYDKYTKSKLYSDSEAYTLTEEEKKKIIGNWEEDSTRADGWYFASILEKKNLWVCLNKIKNVIGGEQYHKKDEIDSSQYVYGLVWCEDLDIRPEHSDMFLVIDGKRITFKDYYTEEWNTEITDINDENGIGKKIVRECRSKLFGKNFYAGIEENVYQRK